MTFDINISNSSLSEAEFAMFCFYLQMAHASCISTSDGVLFKGIPVEDNHHYDDMGTEATTMEYYRWKIKEICTRTLMHYNTPPCIEKTYCLEYKEEELQDAGQY